MLASCSTLRFSYNQGPELLYWWLDGYVDINDDQTPAVRDAIGQWFRWHRQNQLPEYIGLLGQAQVQVMEPATPAAACAWVAEGRKRADMLLEQAIPAITEFARTLTPEQLQYLQRRFKKSNNDFRNDFLQPDRTERQRAAFKRARDRAELLYGSLEDGQRELLTRGLQASPFDPERWDVERRARQQDVLQTLQTVTASPQMPAPQAQALIRALGERLLHSPRPDYRAYRDRLGDYNCGLFAQFHNAATPAQRQHARNRLKGWEDDLRSLTAGAR